MVCLGFFRCVYARKVFSGQPLVALLAYLWNKSNLRVTLLWDAFTLNGGTSAQWVDPSPAPARECSHPRNQE